jgi:hypothetical protein
MARLEAIFRQFFKKRSHLIQKSDFSPSAKCIQCI